MSRAAAVATLLGSMVLAGEAQQVFRSTVDLVHFSVVVTDRTGAPVLGLTRDDFEIIEDGRTQALKLFAGGDPTSAPPVHLAFMIDASGSMVKDLKEVQTAAIKFLNAADNIIDVTLVDFDTEVRVARYNTDSFPSMIERIRMRRPDGYTALYDALGVYLDGASSQTGEKILVLYTDGGDTRSSMKQGDLLELMKASDVTVYSLGYLQHQGSGRHEQQQVLNRFGAITGGQAFFPTSIKDLDRMYEIILREMAGRYSLGYLSSNDTMDGRWREVKVRVADRPELKHVKIRTRGGYYAPYRATVPNPAR